ncbi:GNAT family N-acetyltransferase [Maritimibacter dapengensis]|uniref:GNAT family N-acetyltransferase n=1 Tax=Maritimibacter dapengensis TaxID=2836868 RepID=A0ABS6T567_9RHOB|nr:GNAT family N-acetyltransferase [Maritimibacter dapengensis]MBV7380398.1 GNAT family N-acetyltransferase [Maritimibacter dapengensis]
MDSPALTLRLLGSLDDISPGDWDACACPLGRDIPDDPFTSYRFLHALERSGSVGPGTGWQPQYLTAWDGATLIGVAPAYAKSHSQGEYVFDHSWAHAFERAGGAYYPKLQLAVPFTPVTGRRFLTRRGSESRAMAALVQGAVQIAADNDLSSVHATFCTEEEAAAGKAMGLIHRVGTQYHWFNEGFSTFDAFLETLSSRKRKSIRKDRRTAQTFGGEIVQLTGDELRPEHWDAFWEFYQDTGARKWGSPYLTRAFFDNVQDTMRDDVLLVLALRNGVPIAGALNFIGRDALFGRYWGCVEHHPALHFELCYYQAIDYAIANGLSRVEAGAQGEHKIARGYVPVATHSLHWIAHPGLRQAVEEFVEQEVRMVGEDIEILTSMGPFKRSD